MNELNMDKITKEEFLKLNEDDVLFITNPGRMGDEDGITFVVKKDNNYSMYRVDGWMYPSPDDNKNESISLDDARKQFPEWFQSWDHSNDSDYHGKYHYLYMGFGNGLCVDNRVYPDFKPYLDKKLEKYFENKTAEEKERMQYSAIYSVWKKALNEMINN